MLLLRMFIVFSKISVLAFGGAYSFLPLIEHEDVETNQWLSKSYLRDIGQVCSTIQFRRGFHTAWVNSRPPVRPPTTSA